MSWNWTPEGPRNPREIISASAPVVVASSGDCVFPHLFSVVPFSRWKCVRALAPEVRFLLIRRLLPSLLSAETTIAQQSFPQISTARISISVTNNLYPRVWNEQAGYMRADPPSQFSTDGRLRVFDSAAKSLFRNILPVSPCGPRFCGQTNPPLSANLNEIRILDQSPKKMWRRYPKLRARISSGL
jgi:hypothetical protein